MSTNAPLQRYPEARLQRACTAWLEGQGYRELLNDAEAFGERFDSLGLWDGRLTLIEYKVSVGVQIVRHRTDRAMSLESKIAGGLSAIYARMPDRLSAAANDAWDRSRPPLVGIIAQRFSVEAMTEIDHLLRERASDWCFDFLVGRWQDSFEQLLEWHHPVAPHASRYERIWIPSQVGRTPRGPMRTVAELAVLADEDGYGELFRAFVSSARDAN